VVKRALTTLAILALATTGAAAQQKPATASDKSAIEKAAAEKAAMDNMARMAAQQAEAVARAQQKVAQEEQAAKRAEEARLEREFAEKRDRIVPLDIEIVISRYQGDKKVSSLPYALTVNATSPWGPQLNSAPLTQLRMGGQVPLPTMAPALGPDGKPVSGITGGGPVQYKEVGTDIDARGRWLESPAGSFEIWISVQEDAVATPQGASATSLPVIRTFRAANNLVLRDGQTRQFTAGADRITGEVVKVDVSLKVAK
jgi:hypothetical protein